MSLEATTALLSSLEVEQVADDSMKSKMDSVRSNIDGLMEGLVRDEQSLFASSQRVSARATHFRDDRKYDQC